MRCEMYYYDGTSYSHPSLPGKAPSRTDACVCACLSACLRRLSVCATECVISSVDLLFASERGHLLVCLAVDGRGGGGSTALG